MKCMAARKQISPWLDNASSPAARAGLEAHAKVCAACAAEVSREKKLRALLRADQPLIQPSADFERNFWREVSESPRESRWSWLWESIETVLPSPSFAQALAAVLLGLLVGGAGGAISLWSAAIPQRGPDVIVTAHSLTGFSEYKGLPSASLAAAYLQSEEKRGVS